MVAPSLWLLTSVLIMTFGHFGHKSCHRSCSQSTFYLPQSANSQCSTTKSGCLMEATITIDPTEDSFERVNITLTQLIPGDYLRDHVMYITFTFPNYKSLPSILSSSSSISSSSSSSLFNDRYLNSPNNENTNNEHPISANGYRNNYVTGSGFPRENNRFHNSDLSSSTSSNSYLYPSSNQHTSIASYGSNNRPFNRFDSNTNPQETTVIKYSCRLRATGNATAEVIQGNGLRYSFVSNSFRSCSFTFDRFDYLWPTLTTHHKVDLVNNGDFTVTLGYDDVTKHLRPESLPIHKMAFLRCCHRHHGGSKYLVIIEPSAPPPITSFSSLYSTSLAPISRRPSLDFYLQSYSPIPHRVVLKLTGPREQSLRVNVSNSYFNVSVRIEGDWISVLNNLTLPRTPRRSDPFEDFRLNWTLPVHLETPRGSLNLEEGQYELDIESDNFIGHTEKIYITGKGHPASSSSLLTSLVLPLILIPLTLK